MRYTIVIKWSSEDETYIAQVPELPGCLADGDTPGEAAHAAIESAKLWLETAEELGREIPVPCYYK